MAEREDQQPPAVPGGGLDAEQADVLSERFKPSWEADGAEVPARPSGRSLAKQTLIGIAPVIQRPSGGAGPISSPAARSSVSVPPDPVPPVPTVPPVPPSPSLPPAQALDPTEEEKKARRRALQKQTLIGIAPVIPEPPPGFHATPAISSVPAPAPGAAPASVPSHPPPSQPRGIAPTYRPKDDPSGPAVVLKDEIKRTEAQEEARLVEEQTRQRASRRAQTMTNLKAFDAVEAPTFRQVRPQKSRAPLYAAFGVGGLGILALLVVLMSPQRAAPGTALPSAPVAPAAPVEAETATTAPRSDIPLPPAEVAPTAATSTPAAAAPAPEPKPAGASPTSDERPPRPAATPKATPKPAPRPPTQSSKPPKKSGVIVRDTPF